MIPDVNILVGALQPDDPNHQKLVSWLDGALTGRRKVGFSVAILAGTVRVLTNQRIFRRPPTAVAVIEALNQLLAAPAATIVPPGPRNWAILAELCRLTEETGNLVSDALHAALAIEHGAAFVTLDHDFRRFPDLRVINPLTGL